MQACNRGDQTQPQTVSGRAPTPFKSIKALEHVRIFGGGYSRPPMRNGTNDSTVAIVRYLNSSPPASATTLDVIVYESIDDIENKVPVTHNKHALSPDAPQTYASFFSSGVI